MTYKKNLIMLTNIRFNNSLIQLQKIHRLLRKNFYKILANKN